MATTRNFRAQSGGIFIPVTGGSQSIDISGMPLDAREHHFFIAFVDDSGNLETPTAGTVTVTGSPSSSPVVLDSIPNGSFNAADAYSPALVRPVAQGPMLAARLELDSVVGATNVVASITSY